MKALINYKDRVRVFSGAAVWKFCCRWGSGGWMGCPSFPITCFLSHFLMSGFPVYILYILSFNKQVVISDHPGREQSTPTVLDNRWKNNSRGKRGENISGLWVVWMNKLFNLLQINIPQGFIIVYLECFIFSHLSHGRLKTTTGRQM